MTVGFTGAPRTEQSDRPPHRGLRPLLFFEQCVGSLTSHTIYDKNVYDKNLFVAPIEMKLL